MLQRNITVRNVTDKQPEPKTIIVRHMLIPGGRVEIRPGEDYTFDMAVWRRYSRRYRGQLADVLALKRAAAIGAEPETEAEIEAEVEEVAETEMAVDSPEPPETDLSTLKMHELKTLAREAGVCAPPTMTKPELIAAIEAATADSQSEGQGETEDTEVSVEE